MARAAGSVGTEPLRLEAAWRVPQDRGGVATIHPLRVVAENARRDVPEREELRTLVAEIMREELRTDLGRRMTGSIRQLVREEVARIFARLGPR